MRGPLQPPIGKAVTNESKYRYIVEISVADDELDVEFSRRIMGFHRSRKIEPRHGRRTVSEDRIYFRWCFSDLATARAFMEQFGGELLQKSCRRDESWRSVSTPDRSRRISPRCRGY